MLLYNQIGKLLETDIIKPHSLGILWEVANYCLSLAKLSTISKDQTQNIGSNRKIDFLHTLTTCIWWQYNYSLTHSS